MTTATFSSPSSTVPPGGLISWHQPEPPSRANLYAALAKAQGQMDNAAKTSDNPFFHSKYADLAAVWNAIRKPLSDNGLCVIQFASVTWGDHAVASVRTRLAHESGESVEEVLALEPAKIDPQGMGSAIQYARRYGLMAMVGLAAEDDDGNAASSGIRPAAPISPPPPAPSAPKPRAKPPAPPPPPPAETAP